MTAAHRPDLGRERQAREAAEAEVARLTAELIRVRHEAAALRRAIAPYTGPTWEAP